MRWLERSIVDPEFPGRYALDEARFPGGQERTNNKEDDKDEPQPHYS